MWRTVKKGKKIDLMVITPWRNSNIQKSMKREEVPATKKRTVVHTNTYTNCNKKRHMENMMNNNIAKIPELVRC